jgi:hypothetical protein
VIQNLNQEPKGAQEGLKIKVLRMDSKQTCA